MGGWVGPRAVLDESGKSRPPPGNFFFFTFLTCSFCAYVPWLIVLYKTHNTNIHTHSGIRTRNPSKRATTRIGIFDPRTVQPVVATPTELSRPNSVTQETTKYLPIFPTAFPVLNVGLRHFFLVRFVCYKLRECFPMFCNSQTRSATGRMLHFPEWDVPIRELRDTRRYSHVT